VATSNPDLPPEVGPPSLMFTKARRFRSFNDQVRRDSIRRSYRWLALVLEFGLISAANGGAKETDSSVAGGIDPGVTLTLGSVGTHRIWNPHLFSALVPLTSC
jgi:hypothetical protein